MDCHFQEAKLRVTFPNDAQLRLYGADQREWVERLRGVAFRRIYVDESAFYRVDLRRLIEEVLEPALMDARGSLYLVGTPGDLKDGFFYDVTEGKVPGWQVFTWSTKDNPHMKKQYQAEIARKKKLNPNIEKDPGFQREYLGQWVEDPHGRVYTPAPTVETYERDEATDNYVLGVDFAYSGDQTGYAVGCWSESHPNFTVLEAFKVPKQLVPGIAETIRSLEFKYPGLTSIGDPKQKQFLEELRLRFDIAIYDAEKMDKADWIRLYNSDVATGRVRFVESGTYDLQKEHKELKKLEKPGGRWIEHPGQPNDCSDACLYAYRHCYHYRYEPLPDEPQPGSPQALEKEIESYWQEESDALEEAHDSALRKGKGDWSHVL